MLDTKEPRLFAKERGLALYEGAPCPVCNKDLYRTITGTCVVCDPAPKKTQKPRKTK